MSEECDECNGYNYKLLGCCSGFECGCQGKPVDAIPCPKCNHHGEREPSEQAKIDWPWFFADGGL